MAMAETDIQTGWIYRTSHQQQRLVLGRDRDGRVVYVSKGRNDAAPFHNCHVRITPQKFAQRAIGRLRFVDDVRAYIIANKATTVVVRERRAAGAAAASDALNTTETGIPDNAAAAVIPANAGTQQAAPSSHTDSE
ncbi:MAG: hypothetical protein ACREO8_09800 [Luteimonas sp.]